MRRCWPTRLRRHQSRAPSPSWEPPPRQRDLRESGGTGQSVSGYSPLFPDTGIAGSRLGVVALDAGREMAQSPDNRRPEPQRSVVVGTHCASWDLSRSAPPSWPTTTKSKTSVDDPHCRTKAIVRTSLPTPTPSTTTQHRCARDEPAWPSGDGRIIGFATTAGDDQLELEALFVDPPSMRTGVGRVLIEDLVENAKARGSGDRGTANTSPAREAPVPIESIALPGRPTRRGKTSPKLAPSRTQPHAIRQRERERIVLRTPCPIA